MDYKIEKVESVPTSFRAKTKIYIDIVADIAKKEAGIYKITIENKKPNTVYQQLSKCVKDRKDMKLHKAKEEIFIEKLRTSGKGVIN